MHPTTFENAPLEHDRPRRPSGRRAGARDDLGTAAIAFGAVGVGVLAWLLYASLARVRREQDVAEAKAALTANARKALAMKRAGQDAADAGRPEVPPTPDHGMRPLPNETIAPSGALTQEGQRPVLERSRKVR